MTSNILRNRNELIMHLDLEPMKFKLVHDDPEYWSPVRVNVAELTYKRFLILVAEHPDLSLVPVGDVDKFWHAHVLDTARYAADCSQIFGFFLHHFPYSGLLGREDADRQRANLAVTCEIFVRTFGEPYCPGQCSAGEEECCPDYDCDTNGKLSPLERPRPRLSPTSKPSSRRIRTFDEIVQYQNEDVIERYEDKLGLSPSAAKQLFADVLLFLYLAAAKESDESIVPPKAIDDGWHEFLLFTEAYQKFCTKYLCAFIHHQPFSRADRALKGGSTRNNIGERARSVLGQQLSPNWDTVKADCEKSCAAECSACTPCVSSVSECVEVKRKEVNSHW